MKSYQEYLTEAKAAPAKKKEPKSSRQKCMQALVDALKSTFSDYDIATRKYVWDHLVSARGEHLIALILRNPKTYLSDSEFTKLLMKP